MAISIGGGHLVFGNAGHLKRSSSDHHLLRRDSIIVSSPSELKTGYNRYDGTGGRANVYPALYDNRYDVTWANGSLGASSGWCTCFIGTSYAQSNASYASYDTSSINGTSAASVVLNATSYTAASGGGSLYVGFRTSSSVTAGASYSWITGATELFTITASGSQTKTFSSALTFDDYLFVTVWVAAYEPPTDYFGFAVWAPPAYNPNHLFALSTEFRFNE
jgi:hypothetical protein